MDNPVFEIGDRVVVVDRESRFRLHPGIQLGDVGTVVALDGDPRLGWNYGVDWDDLTDGHSCYGKARKGHGFWVNKRHIAHADERLDGVLPPTADELFGLLGASDGN